MSCSNWTTIWVCECSVKQLVHVKIIVQLSHGIIEGDVNDLDSKNHKTLIRMNSQILTNSPFVYVLTIFLKKAIPMMDILVVQEFTQVISLSFFANH